MRLLLATTLGALIALASPPVEVSVRATDPAAAAKAYFASLDAGDIEAALDLFAEDVVYTISPPSVVTGQSVISGRDQLRVLLTGLVAQRVSIQAASPAQVAEDRATGLIAVANDAQRRLGLTALEAQYELVLDEGKIRSFAFTYTSDSVARVQAAMARAAGAPAAPAPAQVPRPR